MDSRTIYMACSAMIRKVEWQQGQGQGEWRLVGEGDGSLKRAAQDLIDWFFLDDYLYLVVDRHTSGTIARKFGAWEVQTTLRVSSVVLCDMAFRRFVEFHPIGVARYGVRR